MIENLIADVRMLAGLGARAIPIFELSGTVDRWGAEGVRAIVEAAREPMSEAELAAIQERPIDVQTRETFRSWTPPRCGDERRHGAAGRARRPNAYPDGCGDMHALPEPAGLALLVALPLLAWLAGRRRRSSAQD